MDKLALTDTTEIAVVHETAATVLAARAKAEVEARFMMAMQNPRDWDEVRQRLLAEVERPGFADTAWYDIKNRGAGFTIRFAEAALRTVKNLDARSEAIFDSESVRIMLVTVFDLENNVSIPSTITVAKTVERKYLKKGEVAIRERINSYGETVYVRATTDDELLMKTNSAVSKAIRNGVLRLLPGDIQDDCANRINKIRLGDVAKNPDGYKKQIFDAFALLSISPEDLSKFLGHDVSKATADELVMLRSVHTSLKSGEITYNDLFDKEDDQGETPMQKLKNRLSKKTVEKREVPSAKIVEKKEEKKAEDAESAAIERLNELASKMFGAKATEALEFRCLEIDADLDDLTGDEADLLLEVLQEEQHQ